MNTKRITVLVLIIAGLGIGGAYALSNTIDNSTGSTHVSSSGVPWQSVEKDGIPPGMELKRLHTNPYSKGGVVKLRFSSGYIEPQHYHTTAGHSVYVVSGRINYMGVVATAGDFIYTPPNVVHGVVVLEPTEILLWSDGPMDFHLSEENIKE
ncbi:MAG TPA: cupin domain-containing protein [Kangiella sp.]